MMLKKTNKVSLLELIIVSIKSYGDKNSTDRSCSARQLKNTQREAGFSSATAPSAGWMEPGDVRFEGGGQDLLNSHTWLFLFS